LCRFHKALIHLGKAGQFNGNAAYTM
jgi:hypothetical protein